MSRSRKKVPVVPMTIADSDKRFKQSEHRRERADAKVALAIGRDPKEPKAFGNPALGEKDGKQYLPGNPKAYRK